MHTLGICINTLTAVNLGPRPKRVSILNHRNKIG